MKIMGLQFDISWEDKQANFRKVRHMLEKAAPAAGTLVVLPEMFATGFSMNVAAVAEPYEGETEKFLSSLATQHGVYVLGGAAMVGKTGQPRNKALLFAPNGPMVGVLRQDASLFRRRRDAALCSRGSANVLQPLGDYDGAFCLL